MSDLHPSILKDDVSIVLCGEAGQGIQTVEHILTQLFKFSGYNVFSTQEYMSRIRGGSNSTLIRVSSKRVCSPVERIDFLIPFSKGAVTHVMQRISPKTVLLGEKKMFEKEYQGDRAIDVPLFQTASEVGGVIYSNTVSAGMIAGLFKIEKAVLDQYLDHHFSGREANIKKKNIEAAQKGYDLSKNLLKDSRLQVEVQRDPKISGEMIMDGVEALTMGAIAGGCQFVSFYPMSPSTGVAVLLAQHARKFGLVIEQAEDEISAVNMVIGAWYAGARAMVTTSGGGFALMVEGVSLAGMVESPLVVHIGQRPGPATGLPTRTEQGDLLFVLFAGHGEFPRVILAPGTIEEAFYLTQKAFHFADRFQIPVFILTDHYLLESHYNLLPFDPARANVERYIIETQKQYRRYQWTEDGISPRGIPGFGEGLVVLDSDEHDQEGHITEDMDVRTKMVGKRLQKLDRIKEEIIPPELIGPSDYKILIVGWGSNYHVVRESLERLERKDIAFLHFKQVYPLHSETLSYLKRARRTVIIENNATSQFGRLIRLLTGFEIDRKILKYNGLPFSVEEVEASLKTIFPEEA